MDSQSVLSVFLEIVKYFIPALITFLVVYFMLKGFFDSELNKRRINLRIEQNKLITPVKMQAYERLVILMERMTPNSLIFRVMRSGMSASHLKQELIADINNEFNHNTSQQIYVSPQAWQIIRITKEEMVNLINTAYTKLGPNAVGMDLSKAIFEMMIELEKMPTQKALDFLRKEFHIIFD
jgi:cytochrome c oxidase subunit IV